MIDADTAGGLVLVVTGALAVAQMIGIPLYSDWIGRQDFGPSGWSARHRAQMRFLRWQAVILMSYTTAGAGVLIYVFGPS